MDPEPDPFRRLPLDVPSERAVARLRLVAALFTGLGVALLLVLRPPLFAWLCALGGAVAVLAWIVMFARARRKVARAEEHFVALGPEGVTLSGEGARREAPWARVYGIEVDEERLVVRVEIEDQDDLEIEPQYGGLGAYDLAEALERARRAASEAS